MVILQSTFPHTDADIFAYLLFVFVIHTRQQVKHEMNSYQLHWHADYLMIYGVLGVIIGVDGIICITGIHRSNWWYYW